MHKRMIDSFAQLETNTERARAAKRKLADTNQQVSKRKISWEELARIKQQAAKPAKRQGVASV